MRTIRFRGKSIETNKWVYGYLTVGIKHRIVSWDGERWVDDEVHPETIGQLTGMAGKDGKLIWEGDLIRINDSAAFRTKDNPENIGVVTWGRGNYFSNGTYCQYNIFAWLHDIEVVGNVHDNSDMLPKTKNLKSISYINGEFFCAEKESGIPHTCRKQCFACKIKEDAENADLNIEAEESKEE